MKEPCDDLIIALKRIDEEITIVTKHLQAIDYDPNLEKRKKLLIDRRDEIITDLNACQSGWHSG